MNIENNESYVLHAPQVATRMTTRKGIAVAALVVGVLAFFIGWVPFFGLVVGCCAVILGVVALLKKQQKALSVTAISLGALAVVTSIVVTVIALSVTDWEDLGSTTPAASGEQSPAERIETPAPDPLETTKPEKKPEPQPTKKPEPKPSSAPSPEPVTNATSGGMTAGMASVACENALKQAVPGDVKFHWFGGTLAETLENDAWFLKVEFTPKGLDRMVMECTVTGSESAPQILEFDVY